MRSEINFIFIHIFKIEYFILRGCPECGCGDFELIDDSTFHCAGCRMYFDDDRWEFDDDPEDESEG